MTSRDNRFLVALDGSVHSMAAAQYAASFLPLGKTRIVLWNVFNKIPDSLWDLGKGPNAYLKSQIQLLKTLEQKEKSHLMAFMEFARRVFLDAGFSHEKVKVCIQERKKGAARDIMAESENGYEGVVIGARGYGRIQDLAIGNVAMKLVCGLNQLSLCVVAGTPNPSKILLCYDGSEGANKATLYLPRLINQEKQHRVMLFNVQRHLTLPGPGRLHQCGLINDGNLTEERRLLMESIMLEEKRALVKSGIDPGIVRLKIKSGAGSRAEAIIREASENGYGTVMVGRKGLSKIEEFCIGQVSHKLLQLARDKAIWIVG